jgi:hypothetical protein
MLVFQIDFMEAEMDYFGHHNYDLQVEYKGAPAKGAHHTGPYSDDSFVLVS